MTNFEAASKLLGKELSPDQLGDINTEILKLLKKSGKEELLEGFIVQNILNESWGVRQNVIFGMILGIAYERNFAKK